jgi:hypothetical protein
MENVWVFVTTVTTPMAVSGLAASLDQLAGKGKWNFDLDDCDRVLRVMGNCRAEEIIRLLEESGYQCAELADEVPGDAWMQNSRLAS